MTSYFIGETIPRLPRELAYNQQISQGNESWAGFFIYPVGWNLLSFKKLVIKETDPNWAPIQPISYTPLEYRLFIVMLLSFIFFAILMRLGYIESTLHNC